MTKKRKGATKAENENKHYCFSYCCICRYSIMSSGGYYGRALENKIEGRTHYYCVNCYPKAIEIYIAEMKLKNAEKELYGQEA